MKSVLLPILAVAALLPGCQLRYLRETGAASTPTEGMGGFVRYDGYDSSNGQVAHAGDLGLATVILRRASDSATVILVAGFPMADAAYYETVTAHLAPASKILHEVPILPGSDSLSIWTSPAALLALAANENILDLGDGRWEACDMLADNPMLKETLPLDQLGTGGLPLPDPAQVESFAQSVFQVEQAQRMSDFAKHKAALEISQSPAGIDTKRLADLLTQLSDLIDGARLYLRKEEDRNTAKQYVQQIKQAKTMLPFFSGILIDQRNSFVAMRVKQLTKAGNKTLGIYYNAWHADGIYKLLKRQGFEEVERHWDVAWAMNSRGS